MRHESLDGLIAGAGQGVTAGGRHALKAIPEWTDGVHEQSLIRSARLQAGDAAHSGRPPGQRAVDFSAHQEQRRIWRAA